MVVNAGLRYPCFEQNRRIYIVCSSFLMNILLNANSETSNNKAKTIGYCPILGLHRHYITKAKREICPNGSAFNKLLQWNLKSNK